MHRGCSASSGPSLVVGCVECEDVSSSDGRLVIRLGQLAAAYLFLERLQEWVGMGLSASGSIAHTVALVQPPVPLLHHPLWQVGEHGRGFLAGDLRMILPHKAARVHPGGHPLLLRPLVKEQLCALMLACAARTHMHAWFRWTAPAAMCMHAPQGGDVHRHAKCKTSWEATLASSTR